MIEFNNYWLCGKRIMKNISKISITAFLILLIFCTGVISTFAIENKYTNQLLKLNVDKSVNNKVNITVVTSKPYKIKLSPIKRSDNEYVIFLPETYHSITAKPDISSVTDLQDVDVKLIPYIGSQNNNGYTKIIVKTKSSDTKLNINDEISESEPKINNELSKFINKTVPNKTIINKTIPLPKATLNNANKTSVKNTKNSINDDYSKKIVKYEKSNQITSNKYDYPEKSQSIYKSTSHFVSKPITNTQKPDVIEQKTVSNIQEPTPIEQKPVIPKTTSVTEDLQQKPAVNIPATTAINRDNLPVVNPPKSDNNSIKLVLIGVVALLIVFIIVLRYFKSVLAKQMKLAEEKAISNKSEITLPRKQQESTVNNSFRQNLPDNFSLQQEPPDNNNLGQTLPDLPVTNILQQELPVNNSFQQTLPDLPYNIQQNLPINNRPESSYSDSIPDKRPAINPVSRSSNKNPSNNLKVIEGYEIEDNKGIYLVQTKNKQILIGTINSEFFLLKEFNNIQNPSLVIRKEKSLKTKNIYYVQISGWHALVGVASESIKLELVLTKTLAAS